MTKVSNSGRSWSRGRLGSISIKKVFKGFFEGVEEDEAEDEGFIITITGMIGVEGFEGGLVSISRMRFSLPFICLKMKEYCENH